MTAKDQLKLLQHGFTIVRRAHVAPIGKGLPSTNIRIMAKTKDRREWFVLHKDFDSLAAQGRKMDELLRISTIVEL